MPFLVLTEMEFSEFSCDPTFSVTKIKLGC
jgi:hypothetical protein